MKMKIVIGWACIRPTRYAELGYRQDAPGRWRIYAQEGEAATGPFYKTKAELLADLGRYAKDYGCADAQ